jgi:hypothetical protein
VSEVITAEGTLTLTPGDCRIAHGLSFAPRALVLWWSRQSQDGVAPTNSGGLGFAVAGSEAGSIGWIAEDGVARSRTASYAHAGAIVGLVDSNAPLPALTGRVDFLPSGFALRVLTITAEWRVHFLAVGGASVRACAGWLRSPDVRGRQRIAVGLRPDLLLFASISGDGSQSRRRGLSISIGAASSPARQGSVALRSPDAAPPGTVAGAQRTDAAILAIGDRLQTVAAARVASIDADGFSLAWSEDDALQVLYLAIAGVGCRVGAAASPTRPGRLRVRRLGLPPQAIMCFSWGLRASLTVTRIGRLSIGAASGPAEGGAVSWDVGNKDTAVTASHVQSRPGSLLLVPDTQTGGMHASAALVRFERRGFTLDWPQSDGQRREFLYVAIGRATSRRVTSTAQRFLGRIRH